MVRQLNEISAKFLDAKFLDTHEKSKFLDTHEKSLSVAPFGRHDHLPPADRCVVRSFGRGWKQHRHRGRTSGDAPRRPYNPPLAGQTKRRLPQRVIGCLCRTLTGRAESIRTM